MTTRLPLKPIIFQTHLSKPMADQQTIAPAEFWAFISLPNLEMRRSKESSMYKLTARLFQRGRFSLYIVSHPPRTSFHEYCRKFRDQLCESDVAQRDLDILQ